MPSTIEPVKTLIPNTTMSKRVLNGVDKYYIIKPNEGYVLHDKAADQETREGKLVCRYSSGSASCGINYDFTPVAVSDENGGSFIAYGEQRAFYARRKTEVNADHIY